MRKMSANWVHGLSRNQLRVMVQDAKFKTLSGEKPRARTPAPINWASLRGDLDSMREAREAVLLLGMYHSPDASETSECLRLALRASGEYILELSRCLETRPQGKGGWQRFARLDGLREQILAAIEAA